MMLMSLVAGTTILGKSASRQKNPSSNTWHLKDLKKYKHVCNLFFTRKLDPRCKLFENLLVLVLLSICCSHDLFFTSSCHSHSHSGLAGAKAQQTVTELELKFGSPTDHEVMRVMRVICGRLWEGNQFVNFDVFFNTKGF